ncbi:MAG: alanine racemase [Oscillospiraceae bacterium]|nr:alanine racemase [Oscillospiraceae bacterium]
MIDKTAVKTNLAVIRERAGFVRLMADLSANGQGMGVVNAAGICAEDGIKDFAVAELRDAAALREAGFTDSVILMLRSVTETTELKELMELGAVFTVGSYDASIALNSLAENSGAPAEAMIRIDTGFGQYGFQSEETDKILNVYQRMKGIAVTGLYTRIAPMKNAKLAKAQADEFVACVTKLQEQGIDTGLLMALDPAAQKRWDFGERACMCFGPAMIGRVPNGGRELTKTGYIEASLEEIDWAAKGKNAGHDMNRKMGRTEKTAMLDVGWYNGVGLSGERLRAGMCRFRTDPVIKGGGKKAAILGGIDATSIVLDVSRCECSPGSTALIDADPRLVKGLPVIIKQS